MMGASRHPRPASRSARPCVGVFVSVPHRVRGAAAGGVRRPRCRCAAVFVAAMHGLRGGAWRADRLQVYLPPPALASARSAASGVTTASRGLPTRREQRRPSACRHAGGDGPWVLLACPVAAAAPPARPLPPPPPPFPSTGAHKGCYCEAPCPPLPGPCARRSGDACVCVCVPRAARPPPRTGCRTVPYPGR